jgi:predicted nuclease of predicted toxin-antitoxin system
MRLLANENIPRRVVAQLRTLGHDVLAAKESMRGDDDRAVLARATAENRLLLTQDKDFGELAFRAGLSAQCGVILFRLAGTPNDDCQRMLDVLDSRADWSGQFAVVTDDRVRVRPLPPAQTS